MASKKKPTKWGSPSSKQIFEKDGWFIGSRLFTCTDGTKFYQYKVARSMYDFNEPSVSYFGWKSTDHEDRQSAIDRALLDIFG